MPHCKQCHRLVQRRVSKTCVYCNSRSSRLKVSFSPDHRLDTANNASMVVAHG